MDTTQLVRQATPTEYPAVARGYINSTPAAFSDLVDVILPAGSTERHYGPCPWPAIHGARKPEAGDLCVLVFDEQNHPTVVWWEGGQREPERVTTLPASPYDGQVVCYQNTAMAGAGVLWTLRYGAASASTYKWEFVGGSDWFEGAVAAVAEGSGTEFTLTVLPPIALTLPLSGDYDAWAAGTPVNENPGSTDVRLAIGNTAVTKLTEITLGWAQASFGFYTPMSNTGRIAGLGAGEELHMLQAYSVAKQKVRWYGKTLRVRPVRVG